MSVGSPVRLTLRAVLSGVVVFATAGCAGVLTNTPGDSPEQGSAPSAVELPTNGAFSFPNLDDAPLDAEGDGGKRSEAAQIVAGWSLEEKVASLFMIHMPGETFDNFSEVVDQYAVAGFLILGDNIPRNPDTALDLLSRVRTAGEDADLLMAIDQEGGAVARLQPDDLPVASDLGRMDPEATTEATRERSQLVFDAGANVNLGVVADVSPGPQAYIHTRSFGTDAATVTSHVDAALAGAVDGVGVAVKHFPGHGVTTVDTHESLGQAETSFAGWRDDHAQPFRLAIDQDVAVVMFGHLVFSDLDNQPASLSRTWVDLVRQQWGYTGVIATDDLSMLEGSGDPDYADVSTNAVTAVAAGVDLIIDSGGLDAQSARERLRASVEAVVAAVEAGDIPMSEIDQSAVRVLNLRQSLGGVARPLEDTESG